MLSLCLCLFPCPCFSVFCLMVSPNFSVFSFFIKFKSFFFLLREIQEVIVCTHFPYTSVSVIPIFPSPSSVSLPLPIFVRQAFYPVVPGRAESTHFQTVGWLSVQRNIEAIAQQKNKEKINYYSTSLRSLINTLIFIFHFPFDFDDMWQYNGQS